MPSLLSTFKQSVIMIILEDFFFYIFHRIAHCTHPWFPIYQNVHKVHHEYNVVLAASSNYCHFLEEVFVNLTPPYLTVHICSLFYPVHYSMLGVYNFVRMVETHTGHSGYEFPWSPYGLIPF